MFISGPQVIRSVTAEALCGAHFAAKSEEDGIAQIKQTLIYLPQNFREQPPVQVPEGAPLREDVSNAIKLSEKFRLSGKSP